MNERGVERPTGVTILAILSFFGGFVGIVFFEYYTVLSIIGLIISLIQLFVGWGLWNLREWSHPLALLLAIIAIIMAPINYYIASTIDPIITFALIFPALLFGWIIQGIIIFYLNKPEIREVFGATESFLDLKPLRL